MQALRERLRAALPDFVQPRQAATGAASGASGALHVVALEGGMQVQDCEWDAAAQVLHARIVDAQQEDAGPLLHLALPHRAAAPGAVDALARALAGEWGPLRAVAGPVALRGGEAVMQPLALLTHQRAVVPQIEPPAAQPLALRTCADAPTPCRPCSKKPCNRWPSGCARACATSQAGWMRARSLRPGNCGKAAWTAAPRCSKAWAATCGRPTADRCWQRFPRWHCCCRPKAAEAAARPRGAARPCQQVRARPLHARRRRLKACRKPAPLSESTVSAPI